MADKRDRGRRLEGGQIVRLHIALVKVFCLSGQGIRRHDEQLHRVGLKRRVVEGVLPARQAQGAVDIVEIDQRLFAQKIPDAHILLSKRILCKELIVPPALSRDKRRKVRAPGRDADGKVEAHPVVEAAVQHSRGVNPAQPPAHVHQSGFQ